jgi:DNA primase
MDTPAVTFPHVSSWAGTDPRAQPAKTVQVVCRRVAGAAALVNGYLDTELGPARPARGATLSAGTATTQAAPPLAAASELVLVHQAAARFFRSRLPSSWVPGYLTARGFGPAVQQRWQAGYAPAGWDALTRYLRDAGYPDQLIEASGLARRSRRGTLIDIFRDRAMLPIHTVDGTIVAFIGRAAANADPRVPKYLNSPHTALYDKGGVLFGLWEARGVLAKGARPVIVEGPFDAIAITAASPGRYAGLAPCGTALTSRQLAALAGAADLRATGVLVAFDPDQAGHRAAAKAYDLLKPLTDDMTAARFPSGQDPAQILREHGPGALASMLTSRALPLADLVIDAELAKWERWLQHAEGQIHALRAAAPLIAAMPPPCVARQVARLADRLGLGHATVTQAVTDALSDIVATGRVASALENAASQRRSPGQTAEAARTAARDLPNGAQPAMGNAGTAVPVRGTSAQCAAEPQLRGRRVPG